MGIKALIRKIFFGDVKKASPVLSKPQPGFAVDETRYNAILAIAQGFPFFVIYSTEKGTTGLTQSQIRSALYDIAAKDPKMKEVLTDVAIDINTKL